MLLFSYFFAAVLITGIIQIPPPHTHTLMSTEATVNNMIFVSVWLRGPFKAEKDCSYLVFCKLNRKETKKGHWVRKQRRIDFLEEKAWILLQSISS